jgi:7-cyano-7-deazaguanine reductase
MIEITQQFGFDAAHYLEDAPLGANRRLHGHSFYAEVTLKGEPFNQRLVRDFSERGARDTRAQLDHQVLNDATAISAPTLKSRATSIAKQSGVCPKSAGKLSRPPSAILRLGNVDGARRRVAARRCRDSGFSSRAVLDAVPNPHRGRLLVRFTAPEFTTLCPITGQPDFAHLVIDYVPRAKLVESKSLKLYLSAFRNTARSMKIALSTSESGWSQRSGPSTCGSPGSGTPVGASRSTCSGRQGAFRKTSGSLISKWSPTGRG